jgi:hypothetical protein
MSAAGQADHKRGDEPREAAVEELVCSECGRESRENETRPTSGAPTSTLTTSCRVFCPIAPSGSLVTDSQSVTVSDSPALAKDSYPLWKYYPPRLRAPEWAATVVAAFAEAEKHAKILALVPPEPDTT